MTVSVLEIREPTASDIPGLRPIFEHWVKDRNTGETISTEIDAIEASIEASIAGTSEQEFLIATDGNCIMGIQPLDHAMAKYAITRRSMELITALVSDEARGRGVGKTLLSALMDRAREKGASEVVVNSGPRYRLSGWPFWRSQFGEPVAVAQDYYGPNGDAMVWRKKLV